MRIIKLSQTGGRKIKFTITGGLNGEKKTYMHPDQGLDKKCHAISDYLNPGAAVDSQTWADLPPEDIRYEEQAQQMRG